MMPVSGFVLSCRDGAVTLAAILIGRRPRNNPVTYCKKCLDKCDA